jgi:hypothetical protein
LTKYEKRHGKTTGARMNGREMMIVRLEHDDGTMSDDRQAGQGRSHTHTHTHAHSELIGGATESPRKSEAGVRERSERRRGREGETDKCVCVCMFRVAVGAT